MSIKVSAWTDRLLLEQFIVRMWMSNILFLVTSALLAATLWNEAMVGEMYQLHSGLERMLDIGNPMPSATDEFVNRTDWLDGLRDAESVVVGIPVTYWTSQSWIPCQDDISDLMTDIVFRFRADVASSSLAEEVYDPIDGIVRADVRVGSHLLDTVNASTATRVAFVFTRTLNIFTAVSVRFTRSEGDTYFTPVSRIQSVRDNVGGSVVGMVCIAVMAIQLLVDLYFLTVPRGLGLPVSSIGSVTSVSGSQYSRFDELVNTASSIAVLAFLLIREVGFATIFESLFLSLIDTDVSTPAGVTLYISRHSYIMQTFALSSSAHAVCVLTVFMCLTRIAVFMGSHPRLAILIATVKMGFTEIFNFLNILFAIYVIFALFAFLLFGEELLVFSQYRLSLFLLYQLLLAQWPFDDLFQCENQLAVFLFISLFGAVLFLLVLNTYLAVVLNSFEKCKTLLDASRTERTLLHDGYLILREGWLRYRQDWPSRSNIIRALESFDTPVISETEFVEICGMSSGGACFRFYQCTFSSLVPVDAMEETDDVTACRDVIEAQAMLAEIEAIKRALASNQPVEPSPADHAVRAIKSLMVELTRLDTGLKSVKPLDPAGDAATVSLLVQNAKSSVPSIKSPDRTKATDLQYKASVTVSSSVRDVSASVAPSSPKRSTSSSIRKVRPTSRSRPPSVIHASAKGLH